MSGLFGWSLPPGCGTLPGEEDEQPLDLAEDKTLKGYGKHGHGLYSKDADLDYGGQLVVDEAWWFSDGPIKVTAHGYASIVPDEERSDDRAYNAIATEIVCGTGYSGEWDGDYWVFTNPIELDLELDWDDDKTEEQNIEAATLLVHEALTEANKAFEAEMEDTAKAIGAIE